MVKKYILPILSVVLASAFPVLFLYFNNAGETSFSEAVMPLLLFEAVGVVIFVLVFVFIRSVAMSAVCAVPFILLFQNYAAIESGVNMVFPDLKYWHILPICVFVLIHLVWVLNKKIPQDIVKDITFVMTIAFGGLILFNGIVAVPVIIQKMSFSPQTQMEEEKNNQLNEELSVDFETPNVYWLLFDEYSNFDVVEKYYNYDNSDFAKNLEKLGFIVSYDSVNESQQTKTILANYVSLDYIVTDDMLDTEKEEIRKTNNVLFKLFEERGYTFVSVGNTNTVFPMPGISDSSQSNQATTMGGETFQQLLWQKTPIYVFVEPSSIEKVQQVESDFAFFQQTDLYTKSGQFIMMYELLPHQPFIFTRNGRTNNIQNWHNWVDKENYLGQYIYTTSLIEDAVEKIIQEDPNAVIVLQSDHSARSLMDANGNYLIDKFDRRHFLNAVYYQGKNITEISGQSGVNTWRCILNRLFDLSMPLLEVPVSEYEF